MKQRLQRNEYFFSVEGETEVWYLKHLQGLIHNNESRKIDPIITVKKTTPMKFLKTFSSLYQSTVTAVYDVEEPVDGQNFQFESILKEMNDAEKAGKSVKYELGYSNIDFELWVILHKKNLFRTIVNKEEYLKEINTVFSTHFKRLSEYKVERNFKSILNQITLEDVKEAINRADIIEKQRNIDSVQINSCGYKWFPKNPSLSLHKSVNKILKDCGI